MELDPYETLLGTSSGSTVAVPHVMTKHRSVILTSGSCGGSEWW